MARKVQNGWLSPGDEVRHPNVRLVLKNPWLEILLLVSKTSPHVRSGPRGPAPTLEGLKFLLRLFRTKTSLVICSDLKLKIPLNAEFKFYKSFWLEKNTTHVFSLKTEQ